MQLPSALIESLLPVKDFQPEAFAAAHAVAGPVSIRINPGKAVKGDAPCQSFRAGQVPWCAEGFYLRERPSFTADPLLHAGAYYVQEASSMFLGYAFEQVITSDKPLRVLDLCAAPGGKSTHLVSMLPPHSLLVSNEVIRQRVNILAENLIKWGYPSTVVTSNDPADFQRLPGFFDVLVVDAPCSGSGLFRKDPAALDEWSPGNVDMCSRRQQRILGDVLPALSTGGVLIYSTCSYSPEEDEMIAGWLKAGSGLESIRLPLPTAWGIMETGDGVQVPWGYRFFPDRLQGEGFYLAVFRKTDEAASGNTVFKNKGGIEKATAADAALIRPFLKDPDEWLLFKQLDQLVAFPRAQEGALAELRSALYIRKAGVELGTVIRKELIPAHALAVSTIRAASFPEWELEEAQALQYLRRQELAPDTSHRGWVLVTFRHMPLGWVKCLPGRVNNYYPKEWRILNK